MSDHSSQRNVAQQQYRYYRRKSIDNSEVRIRGEGRATLDLKGILSSQYRTFLFYPTNDAVELDKALVMQEHHAYSAHRSRWHVATGEKIHSRHPELKNLQEFRFGHTRITRYFSCVLKVDRKAWPPYRPWRGLAVIEKEGDAVGAQLMKLYQAKFRRTPSWARHLRENQGH